MPVLRPSPHVRLREHEDADRFPFFGQWNTETAAVVATRIVSDASEFRIGQNIPYVNDFTLQNHSPGNRSVVGNDRVLLGKLLPLAGPLYVAEFQFRYNNRETWTFSEWRSAYADKSRS
jgi:hypothetical protein